jgi:hypothetical protein
MARNRSRRARDPVSDSAERLAAFAEIQKVLDTLSEREAGVVSMRFGLADDEPKTLDEIGKAYGVTRERIRQIESKVLSKLRKPNVTGIIHDYLDTMGIAPVRRLTDDQSREQLQQFITKQIAYLLHAQELFSQLPRCPQCSKRVPQPEEGRPRIYCSNKCRQTAYRDRRATQA